MSKESTDMNKPWTLCKKSLYFFSSYLTQEDLSRFGRDHVFSGYYTQMKYPSLGVNFIAIQDNVDIEKGTGVEMMPIQNVFNEWHA